MGIVPLLWLLVKAQPKKHGKNGLILLFGCAWPTVRIPLCDLISPSLPADFWLAKNKGGKLQDVPPASGASWPRARLWACSSRCFDLWTWPEPQVGRVQWCLASPATRHGGNREHHIQPKERRDGDLFDGMGWVVVGNWNDIFPPARKDCFRLQYIYIYTYPLSSLELVARTGKVGGVEDELLFWGVWTCRHLCKSEIPFIKLNSSWHILGPFRATWVSRIANHDEKPSKLELQQVPITAL